MTLGDKLEPTVREIAHAITGHGPLRHARLYRFDGYTKEEGFHVFRTSDTDRFFFQRKNEPKGWVELANITPIPALSDAVLHPMVVQDEDQVAASAITVKNYTGIDPLEFHYDYAEAKREAESTSENVGVSVTNAIRNMLGTGSGTPVKGESEISTSITAEWSKQQSTSKETGTDERAGYSGACSPGVDLKVWATLHRASGYRMMTGMGAMTFSIQIGKRARKHGKKSHGWFGSLYWSRLEDLISVMERKSPIDWDLARHFDEVGADPVLVDPLKNQQAFPFELQRPCREVLNVEIEKEILARNPPR